MHQYGPDGDGGGNHVVAASSSERKAVSAATLDTSSNRRGTVCLFRVVSSKLMNLSTGRPPKGPNRSF